MRVLGKGHGVDSGEPEMVWLLMEWERGESGADEASRPLVSGPVGPSAHAQGSRSIVKQRWELSAHTRISRASWALDHFEGRRLPRGGTTTCPLPSHVSPSSSPSAPALFPPREEAPVQLVRSPARPERHFPDSFITARLAIAHLLARWLPRCPFCHHPRSPTPVSKARSPGVHARNSRHNPSQVTQ